MVNLSLLTIISMTRAFLATAKERRRQLAKFGSQHWQNGTGLSGILTVCDQVRATVDHMHEHDAPTWAFILMEEVLEAMAETNDEKLRKELHQIMAVCAAWLEDLDSSGCTNYSDR